LGEIFKKITSNRIVWIVAGAYFCTGFVRTAIAARWVFVFDEVHSMDKTTMLYYILVAFFIPWLASAGSLASGIVLERCLVEKGLLLPRYFIWRRWFVLCSQS